MNSVVVGLGLIRRASHFKNGLCDVSKRFWHTTPKYEARRGRRVRVEGLDECDVRSTLLNKGGDIASVTGIQSKEIINEIIPDTSKHSTPPASFADSVADFKTEEARKDVQLGGVENYQYFQRYANPANAVARSPPQDETNRIQTKPSTPDHSMEIYQEESDISFDMKAKSIENKLQSNVSLKPALPKKSCNLAAFVGESETLTNLVKLGVDLTKVELDPVAASHITKMSFEKDIEPYLLFLSENGVKDSNMGNFFTKNPKVFLMPLADLETRVNYFKTKKFSNESIASILTKSPSLVSHSVKDIDSRLGFLQKQFALSGDEVRHVITRFPKIALWNQNWIRDVKLTLSGFLGYKEAELKQILLLCPRLYLSDINTLKQRFDYIHNVIGFTHQDILAWPSALRTRLTIIKQRHLFLKHLGRDQFNPKKANFVSLQGLALGGDIDFCEGFAKVPVQQFNDFLKTI